MGRRAHLQVEVLHAKATETGRSGGRQHQGYRLKVLPAEGGARPHRAVPAQRNGSPHRPVLVVPVPVANERAPFQGVSAVKDAAEDYVGGSAEVDQEVEEQVDGPGPAGRWEMRAGGAGLPIVHGRGKAGAAAGSRRQRRKRGVRG